MALVALIRRARWPTPLLLGAPAALLAGAYAWLAADHGTGFLWDVVVHESGRYTLGQTVLYVRHFLREVPVDVAIGLFCAAGLAAAEPAVRRRPILALAAGIVACAVAAVAFAGAARQEGWRDAVRDLLQYRTRDNDAAYGAHWSFHLLSTLWFGTAAPVAAALWAGRGGPVRLTGRARTLLAAAWAWVALLTLVFGVHAEAFTSARYIGHQAREILTHGLITLPLAIGILRLATGQRPHSGSADAQVAGAAPALRTAVWLAIVGIPTFLVVAFRRADFAATAQLQSELAGVVAAHAFEHALDVVLVALVALAAIGALPARAAQQRGQ